VRLVGFIIRIRKNPVLFGLEAKWTLHAVWTFRRKSLSLVGTFIIFSSNQGLLKDETKKRRLKERKRSLPELQILMEDKQLYVETFLCAVDPFERLVRPTDPPPPSENCFITHKIEVVRYMEGNTIFLESRGHKLTVTCVRC